MNKTSYKRIFSSLTICALAAAACVPDGNARSASGSALAAADVSVSAEQSDGDSGNDIVYNTYAEKMADIERRQKELDEQLSGDDEDILSEAETQKIILEQINILNEKLTVINSYMTNMELKISTERNSVNELREQIDDGIESYKKRLRAMYLAGDIGYAEVILSSGDFFDVLMRAELMQRVTQYDADVLDDLCAKKATYDVKLKALQDEQNAYDDQAIMLERQKKELAELYDSSGNTRMMLRQHKQQLEEEQRIFENEIYSYEGILDDLLKGHYTGDADEVLRLQTETDALARLEQLHDGIRYRERSGEVIPDSECRYLFKWPVANHYDISSGVGARWGAYHSGIDIPGEGGFPITAAEAGEVVRVNNSCTHNYGKDGSCGCGGGYGNFVIIDHGGDFITLYGHMTQTEVQVGDKVVKGQRIGTMGTTGYSTGTHLHFELRYEGYVTNPANFVNY